MKKFFSLIAAVLFAGSMMAEPIVISASDVTTIESGATTGLDVTLQDIHIVWEGAYYNPDGSGSIDFRVYANKAMTLTATSNISKVEIAGYCKANFTLSVNNGTVTTGDSYASETTKSTLEDPLIVVENINAASVMLTCTKQMRAYTIRVTLAGGDVPPVEPTADYFLAGSMNNWQGGASFKLVENLANEGEYMGAFTFLANDEFKIIGVLEGDTTWYPAGSDNNYVISEAGEYHVYFRPEGNSDWENGYFTAIKDEEPVLPDPTTCADAAEAALSVSGNNVYYKDSTVYTIDGYVTSIATAYSDQYHNISFWMADAADGGNVLQAFRAVCESEADAPKVGDKVAVTGALTKYNTTPEFGKGCTFEIIERAPVYYVAGSMTEWHVNADYKLVANPAQAGEYMGYFTFAANDQFKVVSSADGVNIIAWFPTGMENNYQISEAGDYSVYFRPEGGVEGWHEGCIYAVKKETLPAPTNCAEAAEAALSVSANNELYNNGAVYTIEGYVTAIKTEYSDQYHNISFWMADAADGGNVLQAYRAACASAADAPIVGDKVAVTGSLTKYNDTPEFAAACTFVITDPAPRTAEEITIDIEFDVVYTDAVAAQGWWQFIAENENYEISISNVATTQAAGTYTVADLDANYSYVFRKADSLSIAFVEGSFELTEGEDGSRTIQGTVTGDDGNIYHIKLVFKIPTAETTVNVEIPEWGVADAAEVYGFTGYILYGDAADGTYVQLTIAGSNPLGHFTDEDCYMGGTGIEVDGKYKNIYSMDINVALGAGDRAIVTADILCLNNTLYHVTTILGEGIDNIDAAVKAIKSIVNGQVVIEKAGKTYNMNGQIVK